MSGQYLCRVVRTQKPAVTPSAGLSVACLCRHGNQLTFSSGFVRRSSQPQHGCVRQCHRRIMFSPTMPGPRTARAEKEMGSSSCRLCWIRKKAFLFAASTDGSQQTQGV